MLIWSYPDPDCPDNHRTWKPVGPPPIGTTMAHPRPPHRDSMIHRSSDRARLRPLAPRRHQPRPVPRLAHRAPRRPASPLSQTVDLAMTRQDLVNALALTHIEARLPVLRYRSCRWSVQELHLSVQRFQSG